MNYFFQIFSRERPKLENHVFFTAHTQICTVWGTETYFVKQFTGNFSCIICGFDHTWKNNHMLIITGTSVQSPSLGKVF